jgi:hypothetical protein
MLIFVILRTRTPAAKGGKEEGDSVIQVIPSSAPFIDRQRFRRIAITLHPTPSIHGKGTRSSQGPWAIG